MKDVKDDDDVIDVSEEWMRDTDTFDNDSDLPDPFSQTPEQETETVDPGEKLFETKDPATIPKKPK